MSTPTVQSTPSNPARIERTIGGLAFVLSPDGLTIDGGHFGPLALTVEQALCLSDFLRGPGARTLVSRLWLAEQHAAALADVPSAD
jgi:hypothetical protein